MPLENIVQILKVGFSGFVFLLVYFGYRLLRKEQDREIVRQQILKEIHIFMGISIVLAVLVGGFDLFKLITSNNDEISIIRQTLDSRNAVIQTLENEKEDLQNTIDVLEKNQLTRDQKIKLGLYYSQLDPTDKDKIRRRDPQKARELLFPILRENNSLGQDIKLKIIDALIFIREKIVAPEDFESLIKQIDIIKSNSQEKEVNFAQVYWAYTYRLTGSELIAARKKSLEHFLKASGKYNYKFTENDKETIKELINTLINYDGYLTSISSDLKNAVDDNDSDEIKEYFDDWVIL